MSSSSYICPEPDSCGRPRLSSEQAACVTLAECLDLASCPPASGFPGASVGLSRSEMSVKPRRGGWFPAELPWLI